MDLKTLLSSIYPISDKSIYEFLNLCEPVKFPKGHIISLEGSVEKSIYLLIKGVVRAYKTLKGEEITFWIGEEGQVVCSMKNYVEKKPSYETIETLEDCILYKIDIHNLEKLYSKNIEIANWGRKFIEHEIIDTENRLISQLFLSGKDRYDHLLKNRPHLLQRIPLGIIASYLGMTQVSLSRIRAQK